MVQLKMAGVRRVPLVVRPITLRAFIAVPPENFSADVVRNMPIMFETLAISLQNIHAYS
jgi:hypothetical protein